MGLRKTREGRMGVLTVPQGTHLYRRRTGGKTHERAKKEFDVLAMPTSASAEHGRAPAYSFKLREEFWYVLKEDIPAGEE